MTVKQITPEDHARNENLRNELSARAEELKKHAVEFVKKCIGKFVWNDDRDLWIDNDGEAYTTEQLYNLFNPPKP